mmetsp:Transcript_28503/g.51824  ORF Transcript_28503/g.51824 Transcript_28503/m.51824 type:complete len:298 (+) Transcript_28503:130-1023(+)
MKVAVGASLLSIAATLVLDRSQVQQRQDAQEGELELASKFAIAATSVPPGATRDLLSSFEICGVCERWQRFGEFFDGGYVMCMDHLAKEQGLLAGFSLGVEHHDQWSEDVVDHMHIPVYQMDCTVSEAPAGCSNCHFFKKCLKSADGSDDNFAGSSWTLAEALDKAGMANAPDRSLLMKMDIESSEWAIFEKENVGLLQKFQQVIVEFHGLLEERRHPQYLKALQTILAAGFHVAHLHGNNYADMYKVGGYQVPNVVEVTFTSGPARAECAQEQEYFLSLDHANNATKKDLPLAELP